MGGTVDTQSLSQKITSTKNADPGPSNFNSTQANATFQQMMQNMVGSPDKGGHERMNSVPTK